MSDFGSSQGAGFGTGRRSGRLERSTRGDPRARRAEQAQLTTEAVGQGLGRDDRGRMQIDVDALMRDPSFLSQLYAKLEAEGFVRQ